MIGVTILGATGSIGASTLDVVGQHPDRFHVVALTANRDAAALARLCARWRPRYAVLAEPAGALALERLLAGSATRVLSGIEGLERVASLPETDYVMAAIVGAAGLLPTIAAARAGKRVLLANKEALVMSGPLFMQAVRDGGAELLPIDSEHNAIFQCMPRDFAAGLTRVGVQRILLTASGGPFRTRQLADLEQVTPDEACAHPNWVMGRKISVDSATLMNKGLELVEACWLFATTPDKVEVVLHPQSVVHSLVEYSDGSVLAQLGNPDMRTPIAHALAWPGRMGAGVERLNLFDVARLDFEPPDATRFPCLRLARAAMEAGGTATAILNAANEVAVAAFLQRRIGFMAIAAIVEEALQRVAERPADTLETILAADRMARDQALGCVQSRAA